MELYCYQHKDNHRVTVGEAERLIQAALAMYSDVARENPYAQRDEHEPIPCPLEVLRCSFDSEMYIEHVEQAVECRRATARKAVAS